MPPFCGCHGISTGCAHPTSLCLQLPSPPPLSLKPLPSEPSRPQALQWTWALPQLRPHCPPLPSTPTPTAPQPGRPAGPPQHGSGLDLDASSLRSSQCGQSQMQCDLGLTESQAAGLRTVEGGNGRGSEVGGAAGMRRERVRCVGEKQTHRPHYGVTRT